MTDLVPYGNLPAVPESPSSRWRIVKAEPVHLAGRSHYGDKPMLNLILEHDKGNGEIVSVEVYVDAAYKLVELLPFLTAAEYLPDGIRIKVYTNEKVPWRRGPSRLSPHI